ASRRRGRNIEMNCGMCFEKVLPLMKSKGKIFLVVALLLQPFLSRSQTKSGTRLPYIIEGIDTIPVVNLPDVNIVDFGPDYEKRLKEYYRLRFNVIKVYPYARLAGLKINQLNEALSKMSSDRDRK